MKKKLSVCLPLLVVLFFGCSDLSVDKNEALEVELPSDFSWKEYASINSDVPASQIVFDIQRKLTVYSEFKADSAKERFKDCMEILADLDFAGKIYMGYANCPKKGWDENNSACTGLYANNPNYTIEKNGVPTCKIGACWSGGWDEPLDPIDYPGSKQGFYDELQEKIANYNAGTLSLNATTIAREPEINMLCRFILPRSGNSKAAEDYLKGFYYDLNSESAGFGSSIDSTLVKQHYFLVGRSEGRPYKYCTAGAYDDTKTRDRSLALEFKQGNGYIFYDYGLNLFCLNKSDEKIYLVKDK